MSKPNFAVRFTLIITLFSPYYAFLIKRQTGLEEPWYKNGIEESDIDRNVSQLITNQGYDVEEHEIQTEDGYIIGIQRIPRPRYDRGVNRPPQTGKAAVLLMHGLAESSADWVWNFPNQSLGFILADAGYDVWLGNVRGNEYGQKHVSLSTESEEFWAYTWDEMAEYDLKSTIDYIIHRTGARKIRIVGFSLGINIAMALLSEKPAYQEIVHSVIAMAPAVYIKHMRTEIRQILPILTRLASLAGVETFGLFNKNSPTKRKTFKISIICGNRWVRPICLKIMPMFIGPSSNEQLNYTRIPVYLSKIPNGISFRMIKHSVQQGTAKVFCKFDFGKAGNRINYGQDTPPIYRLDKVKTPVAIFYGNNDRMVPPADVERFKNELKNVMAYHRVEYGKWSHLDFVWGLETYKYVYSHVLKYLRF